MDTKFSLYDDMIRMGDDPSVFNSGDHALQLTTEIKVFKTRSGKVICEIDDCVNDIVIGGVTNVLQNMFGVEAPVQTPTINSILGILNTNDIPSHQFKVLGFMVGIEGSGLLPNSIKQVKYNATTTMGPIPLRRTKSRIDPSMGYILCKETADGFFEYYGKKFNSPKMYQRFIDGTDIDDGFFLLQNPPTMVSYVEVILDITQEELHEYASSVGIETPFINSVGLIGGKLNPVTNEVEDARLMTLFNTKPHEMDSMEEGMRFRYRVFAK